MLYVSEPVFLGNEHSYVDDALRTKTLSMIKGSYVQKFEQLFAKRCGVKHAVAVSNGTTALHAALLGLGLLRYEDVIVPATTYISTATAVSYCGAKPIIVDVRPDTWTIDWRLAEQQVRRLGAAGVIPVDLFGVPALDFDAVNTDKPFLITSVDEAWVLRDSAEAHGATAPWGVPLARYGRAAIFSFYANKILTCGEGGMVVTDDQDLAARVRKLRGMGQSERRYIHDALGFNWRLTNVQGALGLAQLEKIDEHLSIREGLYQRYQRRLAALETQKRPVGSVAWVYPVLVPNRDTVAQELQDAGIETRPIFPALNTQPIYLAYSQQCPVAERLAREGLLLPLHANMHSSAVDRVCDVLLRAL